MEMQIIPTMSYYCTHNKMSKIQKVHTKCQQGCRILIYCWWQCEMIHHFGKHSESLLKIKPTPTNHSTPRYLVKVMKVYQLTLLNCGFLILRFNQLGMENTHQKIPESSKQENLDLSCASNNLHSIYILLRIISNPEMI